MRAYSEHIASLRFAPHLCFVCGHDNAGSTMLKSKVIVEYICHDCCKEATEKSIEALCELHGFTETAEDLFKEINQSNLYKL